MLRRLRAAFRSKLIRLQVQRQNRRYWRWFKSTHVPILAQILYNDLASGKITYKEQAPLQFSRIIIDHARRPKEYHTHFIIFLLCVIVFCLAMLVVGV